MNLDEAYRELTQLIEWLDINTPVETDHAKTALYVLWKQIQRTDPAW